MWANGEPGVGGGARGVGSRFSVSHPGIEGFHWPRLAMIAGVLPLLLRFLGSGTRSGASSQTPLASHFLAEYSHFCMHPLRAAQPIFTMLYLAALDAGTSHRTP